MQKLAKLICLPEKSTAAFQLDAQGLTKSALIGSLSLLQLTPLINWPFPLPTLIRLYETLVKIQVYDFMRLDTGSSPKWLHRLGLECVCIGIDNNEGSCAASFGSGTRQKGSDMV